MTLKFDSSYRSTLKGLGRQYSSYTVYGEALPEFKEQTHFDF